MIRNIKKMFSSSVSLDDSIVYRQNEKIIRMLHPNDLSCNNIEIKELKKSLIIDSGFYSFNGKPYDCTRPGIYRFAEPQKKNLQRVVFEKGNVFSNIKMLSLLSIRGNCDNRKSIAEKKRIVSQRYLRVTCTYNCLFVKNILSLHGVSTRLVQAHTLEPMDSYNNGHSLLEFFSDELGKFIVVDVDKKGYFTKEGIFLDMFELSHSLHLKENFEFTSFTNLPMMDFRFEDINTSYDYSFIETLNYASDEGILNTIKRTCQFPVFNDNGKNYYCIWQKEQADRVSQIDSSWIHLSKEDFYQKFYKV
jgi:hypothetical protein